MEQKKRGCLTNKDILSVLLWKKDKLLGMIQIKGIIESDFRVEDREFVETLTQFIEISLENITATLEIEKQVLNRTKELKSTLNEMHEQHHQLKTTQTQLVHTAKMSGLGTMTAGVAHELNNPNNFIYVESQSMRVYLDELNWFFFSLLEEGNEDDVRLGKAFEEKIGPVYQSLNRIKEGAKRIISIVKGLRLFSRLDESNVKMIDVIESLGSVVVLVRANYRDQVNFVEDYQFRPVIECCPAELNQAFMNILINGCLAIVDQQEMFKENFSNPFLPQGMWVSERG